VTETVAGKPLKIVAQKRAAGMRLQSSRAYVKLLPIKAKQHGDGIV